MPELKVFLMEVKDQVFLDRNNIWVPKNVHEVVTVALTCSCLEVQIFHFSGMHVSNLIYKATIDLMQPFIYLNCVHGHMYHM